MRTPFPTKRGIDVVFEICEIFPSIQGEGIGTGLPTVFVRFYGCNLSCSWCDTAYSCTGEEHSALDHKHILKKIGSYKIPNVCLTGGEPLLQEGLVDLIEEMIVRGLNVDIETNGSLSVSELVTRCPGIRLGVDVKTPSSGMSGSFLMDNLNHLRYDDSIKFIIEGVEDLSYALEFIGENIPKCNVILTPCSNTGGDMIVEALLKEIKASRKLNPEGHDILFTRTRVMIQTHRAIWGNRRGV